MTEQMASLDGRVLANAALDYTERGLRVIALCGKAPNGRIHPHGVKDAFDGTMRMTAAIAAFYHPETTGIGILTGYPYYVVDIDGELGAQTWKAMVGPEDFIPSRWVARTGRGLHLWYADEAQWPTAKLGDQLDFKANGGYVAAPPSLHPDGHRYEWLVAPGEGPPMEMPAGLLRWLRDRDFQRARSLAARDMFPWTRHEVLEGGMLWATVNFGAIISGMASEEAGNRNNYLHWAAATMAEEGATEDEMTDLYEAAIANGLARLEARRTIQSASRRVSRG